MGGAAVSLLAEARLAGLEVRAEPDRLVVRGPRHAEPLAKRLLERKGELLALLAAASAQVEWRVAAMRPQVPRRGPIPVLVARDAGGSVGGCASCGDPLDDGHAIRCALCARAAWLVLHEVREGVGQ